MRANEGTSSVTGPHASRRAALCALVLIAACARSETTVGLITKSNTNPFFVKMREGAEVTAKELGLELRTFSGRYDGDNDTQVQAIENLIAVGATAILITANDPQAIVPAVQRAREAGVLVIAIDTPLDPMDAADATIATDNFKAGELIGRWAAATLGERTADARIAMLNLNPNAITVDVARDQGFLRGFGIEIHDPNVVGDETDPRIVGHDVTQGAEEGGRRAMENLLQRDPSINVVYTVNEPSAAGAFEALKAVGREHAVTIVSVDGGCAGVADVRDGVIGATAMQFPVQMAVLGVRAAAEWSRTGAMPEPSPGLAFYDTGVELITDRPAGGIPVTSSTDGLTKCWG
jgi:fructose transport system substrate-binding protein